MYLFTLTEFPKDSFNPGIFITFKHFHAQYLEKLNIGRCIKALGVTQLIILVEPFD